MDLTNEFSKENGKCLRHFLKGIQQHYQLEKWKLKLLWDSILYQAEWLRSISQVTAHAGEDVEQRGHFSIAGGSINLYRAKNPLIDEWT